MDKRAGKFLIIGVGNLLLKDEGVGIHVARELQKRVLPSWVEVIDGGVVGIGLLEFLQKASKVVLIDAAEMDLNPGAVIRFTPEEVKTKVENLRFSVHHFDLLQIVELAKALGQCLAQVVILGIQPKEIRWEIGLTPEVQAVVPKVMEVAWKEMDHFFASDQLGDHEHEP